MKLISFSFKREALWMMIPTLAALVALVVAFFFYLLRRF